MRLERVLLEIIQGQRRAPCVQPALTFLSVLFRGAVRSRHWAYDRRLLSVYRAPIPTFSIGNISVGGTGKTPLVQLLAETLQEAGRVAILSRGFKSRLVKAKKSTQISRGDGPLFSAAACGDEPFLLAQQTTAAVWVGADRTASAREAHAQGAQCLLLDDGLQHRQLARDMEIITLDAKDPFGRGKFLPAGLLRDFPERLQQADLIVAMHIQTEAHYEEIKNLLSVYTPAPVIGMQHAPVDASCFKGRKVGAFCGIAQPDRFYETLRALPAELISVLSLGDHAPIREAELQAFAAGCYRKGAEQLVCTEKDWVKLPQQLVLPLPLAPLRVRLRPVAGQEHWDAAVQKMRKAIEERS